MPHRASIAAGLLALFLLGGVGAPLLHQAHHFLDRRHREAEYRRLMHVVHHVHEPDGAMALTPAVPGRWHLVDCALCAHQVYRFSVQPPPVVSVPLRAVLLPIPDALPRSRADRALRVRAPPVRA